MRIESETATPYNVAPLSHDDDKTVLCDISERDPQLIIDTAKRLSLEAFKRDGFGILSSPTITKDFLTITLAPLEHECFYIVYLDTKHQIIHHETLFRGTIDNAHVPVREVVKEALKHNAAAVIVAHNHPSGVAEPSAADKSLTESIRIALNTVSIKLLDHLVIGTEVVSLAELGLL